MQAMWMNLCHNAQQKPDVTEPESRTLGCAVMGGQVVTGVLPEGLWGAENVQCDLGDDHQMHHTMKLGSVHFCSFLLSIKMFSTKLKKSA